MILTCPCAWPRPPPLSHHTPLVTAISFRRRLVALAGRLQYTAHGDEGVVCRQLDHQGLDHRAPETAQAAPGEVLSLQFLEDVRCLHFSLSMGVLCGKQFGPTFRALREVSGHGLLWCKSSPIVILLSACCIYSYFIQTSAQADRRNYLVARRRMCS